MNFISGLLRRTMSTLSAKETLREKFGYAFNENGQLRKFDKKTGEITDQSFEFNVSKKHSENQKNYEALGEVITDYVYELMEENGLHKIYLPSDIPSSDATFVFSTQKELKNPKKLMILIHGTGVVRAGQWARSLIINHSTDSGTVLPYVEKARSLGYEVIITNTNDNYRNGKPIPQNESPQKHADLVWQKIVSAANPEAIAIVAHSYGGVVTSSLAKTYSDDFKSKVFAVGFTDSVHSAYSVPSCLAKVGRNYVTSSEKVGTPIDYSTGDVPTVSAGHTKHEMTSYYCMDHLFTFVEDNYQKMFATADPQPKKPKVDL